MGDIAVIQKIVQVNVILIKKLISVWSAPSYDVQGAQVPVSLDFLKNLPKLVAVKFSPIAHLLQEDTSDQVATFLLSLLNNPNHWLPPFPRKTRYDDIFNGVVNDHVFFSVRYDRPGTTHLHLRRKTPDLPGQLQIPFGQRRRERKLHHRWHLRQRVTFRHHLGRQPQLPHLEKGRTSPTE